MRTIALALIIVAAMATPGAAETAAGAGPFAGYRFGMTEAEVIAVDPAAGLRRQEFPGIEGAVGVEDVALLRGPLHFRLAGVPFARSFSIRDGRLVDMSLTTAARAPSAQICTIFARKVIEELEASIGIFAGPRSDAEYGAPQGAMRTARGSELRLYTAPGGKAENTYANWRGAGFAEVRSRFGVREAVADVCALDVVYVERPYVDAPATPPPTQEALAAAAVIADPDWRERPDSQSYERFFPEEAILQERSGVVDLDCLVIAGDALSCRIEKEAPTGWSFGQAALNLAREFRIEPRIRGVPSIGRRVQVRIPFNAAGSPDEVVADDGRVPSGAPRITQEELRALAANAPSVGELAAATLMEGATFTQRPTGADFVQLYPQAALVRGVSGAVVLECLVLTDGRLRCRVAEEVPADAGFGLAALAVAQKFRVAPAVAGAATPGRKMRIPIRFNVD